MNINELLNLLEEKFGFFEKWCPSPVHSGDRVVGSIWHYYNPRTKVCLNYNWYSKRFHAYKQ